MDSGSSSLAHKAKAAFVLPEGAYLLSHSVGCLPVGAEQALAEAFLDPWRAAGGDAWPHWLQAADRFRAAVARLIGASPADIAPQANVSSALAKALHALPRRAGRTALLLTGEDFPSCGFVLSEASRTGFEPRFLNGDPLDPAAWADALADDVHLALVTHAYSNRSARLPVADITAIARERGIATFVDAVQTLGVVPVDIARWSADFVAGSCVKFLCGGPGAGFLWVRPETAAACRPIDTGWFSHADPFAFDIHDFRPAKGATRFWGGTPSIAPFVLAAHGIEALLGFGIEAIRDHNQTLIDRLHGAWGKDAIASHPTRHQRGNAVLLRVREPSPALAALRDAGIYADARAGAIRVSPHLYNDADDIDRLVETLEPFRAI
jgi:kynureninase